MDMVLNNLQKLMCQLKQANTVSSSEIAIKDNIISNSLIR